MKRIFKIIVTSPCNFDVTIVTMLRNLTYQSYKVTESLHRYVTMIVSRAKALTPKMQSYTVIYRDKISFFYILLPFVCVFGRFFMFLYENSENRVTM